MGAIKFRDRTFKRDIENSRLSEKFFDLCIRNFRDFMSTLAKYPIDVSRQQYYPHTCLHEFIMMLNLQHQLNGGVSKLFNLKIDKTVPLVIYTYGEKLE
jgi:hypothetical protein